MKEREKYWKKSYGDDSTFAQGYVYNKKQSKSVADNPQGKNCEEELGRLESFPGSGATYRILEVTHSNALSIVFGFISLLKSLIKMLSNYQESKHLEFEALHSFVAEPFRGTQDLGFASSLKFLPSQNWWSDSIFSGSWVSNFLGKILS